MHHNDPHAGCGHIQCACDSAFTLQAHLPEPAFEMLQVGLADAFQAVRLNYSALRWKLARISGAEASSAALVPSSINPICYRTTDYIIFAIFSKMKRLRFSWRGVSNQRCWLHLACAGGGGAGQRDVPGCPPDRAVAGAALSVIQREGKSNVEDYAGGHEGAGSSVDH